MNPGAGAYPVQVSAIMLEFMQTILNAVDQCYSCGDWFNVADLEEWICREILIRHDKHNHNITYLICTGKKVRKLVCCSCTDFLTDEFGFLLTEYQMQRS